MDYRFSYDGGLSWSNSGANTPHDGSLSVEVRQDDVAGNPSVESAPFAYTLDTTPPVTPTPTLDASTDSGTLGDQSPAHPPANRRHGRVRLRRDDLQRRQCRRHRSSRGRRLQITITAALTPDGVYNITAQATDAAGNTGRYLRDPLA